LEKQRYIFLLFKPLNLFRKTGKEQSAVMLFQNSASSALSGW